MKKFRYTWSIYLVFFLIFGCSSNQTSNEGSAALTTKYVEDTIMSLKEVQEKNMMIDSITNHKHGVALIIEKPNEDESNFYIQVGYNSPQRFETYYHFYLDTATNKIAIDDFAQGKRILLDDWRKQNSDSVYLSLGMELLESENINGLKIGLEEYKINNILGNIEETSDAQKWESDGLMHQTWIYKGKGIELDMCWEKGRKKTVNRITISKPCSYKTAREIGIGSTKEQVRDAYKIEINPRENVENMVIAGSIFDGIVFEFENNLVKSIFIGASAE